MTPSVRGYIFSRPFAGERVPQHVQNLVIRDYCQKQSLNYLLSATEYAMPDSYLMLEQVLRELPGLEGIVAYSLFQLPRLFGQPGQTFKRFVVQRIAGKNFFICRLFSAWIA